MRRQETRWTLALLALALAAPMMNGCAQLKPDPETPMPAGSNALASLSGDELEGAPYASLYEAIQSLRGVWLRRHGVGAVNDEGKIMVYLDGNRLGGVETLRSIATMSVASVRRLTSPEAQAEFGMNHPQGAIVVVSRSQ